MQLGEQCKLLFRFYFRSISDLGLQKHIHHSSNEEQEDKRVAIEPTAREVGQVVLSSC